MTMPPGAAGDAGVASPVLIDAHTHFWSLYDQDRFLDAASRNFDRAERQLGLVYRATRVLLVMETDDAGCFRRSAGLESSDSWRLEPTAQRSAVLAAPSDEDEERRPLLLVEGRQLVTAEGLELLAAPCAADLPEGRSFDESLSSAREASAIPILPWGFGKWWGSRGRLVAELLESHRPSELLLADNGGRPRFGWKPRLLTLAAQRGFRVVRGSDPLPLASDFERVGSFGSLLRGRLDSDRPASAVRRLLGRLATSPRPFGEGITLPAFFANQLRLRLRGRSR